MMRNKPRGAAVYGVDLGKNLFHIVGLDVTGQVIQKAKFRRETVLVFFERADPAVVGMEACPGSQWFARKLQAMGHTVRIIPAQFVKPYVKSNKNDTIDAAAIAEAVTRPTMRFVEVKNVEQVDLQVLHRIRDQMVTNRTRLIWSNACLLPRVWCCDPPGRGQVQARSSRRRQQRAERSHADDASASYQPLR